MGYLSPFLNEDLARGRGIEMRSVAAVQRQARAARRARGGPVHRWKSRLGWALVNAGLSLVSQPPGGVRGRGYALDNPGPPAFRSTLSDPTLSDPALSDPVLSDPVLTRAEAPVRFQCGCDA